MTERVKWPVGGYAPGGYAGCKCNICGEHFIAAKRAYTCADCTIQTLLAERDRLREALAEHSMPCTCHEAYSGRKMQDPECRAGEYGDYCREAIGLPPLCQYNIRALKGDQT